MHECVSYVKLACILLSNLTLFEAFPFVSIVDRVDLTCMQAKQHATSAKLVLGRLFKLEYYCNDLNHSFRSPIMIYAKFAKLESIVRLISMAQGVVRYVRKGSMVKIPERSVTAQIVLYNVAVECRRSVRHAPVGSLPHIWGFPVVRDVQLAMYPLRITHKIVLCVHVDFILVAVKISVSPTPPHSCSK